MLVFLTGRDEIDQALQRVSDRLQRCVTMLAARRINNVQPAESRSSDAPITPLRDLASGGAIPYLRSATARYAQSRLRHQHC